MILTLILLSIGALLFLVIAYNVVQQYKQKAEADKRQAIARHKAVAGETEEELPVAHAVDDHRLVAVDAADDLARHDLRRDAVGLLHLELL